MGSLQAVVVVEEPAEEGQTTRLNVPIAETAAVQQQLPQFQSTSESLTPPLAPAPPPPPPPPPAPGGLAPPETFQAKLRRKSLAVVGTLSTVVTDRKHTNKSQRAIRMLEVMKNLKSFSIPPDSILGRYWYVLMLTVSAYSYITFTRCVVYDNVHTGGELAVQFICSLLLIIDAFIHYHIIVRKYKYIALDFAAAIPLEVILMITPTNYAARVFITLLRGMKLARVPQMFSTSMPDAIDVEYVHFYYHLLPSALFLYWFMTFLHTLVMIKLLCRAGVSYHEGLSWVWILLTSAPVNIEVVGLAEEIFSGFLMTASMILQGYVVGAMSMIVFSYSVKDENRTQMLVTLEMLRHYNLPPEVQHEVLSFQFHILEDSSLRSNSSVALERLPPTMLLQIQLYVKVDILNRAKFFDEASSACKLSIAEVMTQRIVEPDENIVTVGDIGDAMYFMFHGMADVILPNGLCVATIRRGDCFGEIALLSPDCRRKATVKSLTYCDLLELFRDDFDEVIHNFPEFLDTILQKRNESAGPAPAAPPPPPVLTASPSMSSEPEPGLPVSASVLIAEYDVRSTGGFRIGGSMRPREDNVPHIVSPVHGDHPMAQLPELPVLANSAPVHDNNTTNTFSGSLPPPGATEEANGLFLSGGQSSHGQIPAGCQSAPPAVLSQPTPPPLNITMSRPDSFARRDTTASSLSSGLGSPFRNRASVAFDTRASIASMMTGSSFSTYRPQIGGSSMNPGAPTAVSGTEITQRIEKVETNVKDLVDAINHLSALHASLAHSARRKSSGARGLITGGNAGGPPIPGPGIAYDPLWRFGHQHPKHNQPTSGSNDAGGGGGGAQAAVARRNSAVSVGSRLAVPHHHHALPHHAATPNVTSLHLSQMGGRPPPHHDLNLGN